MLRKGLARGRGRRAVGGNGLVQAKEECPAKDSDFRRVRGGVGFVLRWGSASV